MSATTIERSAAMGTEPGRPRLNGLNARMVIAEFLKVRKRRGLVIWSALLTVGAVAIVFSVLTIMHAANPAKYGPAGGVDNLRHALTLLSMLGGVAAVLVGAWMGAGDVQSGVFRDLVSTGRSRLALFAARIPGGLALLLPLVALAWAVASVATVVFAGTFPVPTVGIMVEGGLWILLSATVTYLVALGLASLAGSRSITIGVLLAWQLALSPLLLQISSLGAARQAILEAPLGRLVPALLRSERVSEVGRTMSLAVAGLVIVAWAVIALAVGAWRTQTRDA